MTLVASNPDLEDYWPSAIYEDNGVYWRVILNNKYGAWKIVVEGPQPEYAQHGPIARLVDNIHAVETKMDVLAEGWIPIGDDPNRMFTALQKRVETENLIEVIRMEGTL